MRVSSTLSQAYRSISTASAGSSFFVGALRWLAAPVLCSVLAVSPSALGQVNVTTYHNDIGRTGQNLNETILTPSNVQTQFGKLFSQTVDGQIYTQPLYMSGITIGGATHNVVYVATENDSVYAFDADTNGGSNASPLWMASMLTSAHGAASGATAVPSSMLTGDIQPLVGITGTPVIDPSTGTLYVVSKTLESSAMVQRLHALDITSGAEKFGGPVIITASVPGTGNGSSNGTLAFDTQWENQRPGLLLLNGIVWIGFASHSDNGPWHGWILGYKASTLQQTGVYCTSPNGTGSGVWMSGGGLAADQLDPVNKPYGRMFIPTGNGDFTATKPYTNNMDYGDSEVVLDLTNGVPTVTDDFTTYLQANLNSEDGDIASGGMLVLPTQTTGNYPHLAVQVGKQGWMYITNRDNMGGYSTNSDTIAQELQFAVGGTGAWSSAAYWNNHVYWWGKADKLKSFAMTNGVLSTTPTTSSETYAFPGATPSISANGNTNAIVWTIDTETYVNPGPAMLQAHDATNVATTLYSSGNLAADKAGNAVKFATPTIANGKVYVAASGELDFYGLKGGTTAAATPVITPGSESYTGSVSVTITDTTPSASIYYTTDGSTPTTASTLYTGAITVTTTETIKAIASATGYVTSAAASATYTNTAAVPVVTFSLPSGTYSAAQSLTLSDTQSGASIYYTTDGSTPTTSSTKYTSPITISSTETITAFATASGMNPSPALAQTYTIVLGATGIQYSQGFAASSGQVILNGTSQLNDSRLQLTDGLANEAGSAFYYTPVSVQTFTTDFSFQLSNPSGEGIAFVIQNASAGSAAIGSNGAGLGYAGIANSLAIKFDLVSDAGEGPDSTGLYTGGATPTVPAIDLSSTGINLHSDDQMSVHLTYNGTTLSMTITDIVTGATWSTSWTINIPSTIGSNTAYVGFTGSTGTLTASQKIMTWSYYTTAPAATPTFSPAGGTYSSSQTVTISDTTSGATIYYTTNGTTPTTSSTKYTGAITVSSSETLNAIAVATGFSQSATASATYSLVAATPTFSPAAGTYSSAQTVTISDTTPGATIYYTTNGTTPTTSSSVYSGAINVSASETLNAIAVATNYSNSAVGTAAYVIGGQAAATPTFSPAGASYTTAVTVSINDATSGSTIYYTTNGTTPTTSSSVYTAPIPVSTNQTLNAIAVASGYSTSNVGTSVYSIMAATPVFSPAPGTYNGAQTVTISDPTAGVSIYYTTNGTTPTTSSSVYSGPITISNSGPLQAIAVKSGLTNSYVSAGVYTINASTTAAAPVFSVAGGTYSSNQTVTISDATSGATIYYTTNGTTPTASSTKYTGAITVSSSETLQAIAVASGYTNSSVTSATYTLVAATPVFSPAGGTYSSSQTVTISDATSGATIYYTTNGTTPTASSTKYTGAITVSSSETLEAIAVATGYTNSAVATAAYTIQTTAATPVFSPAGGTYSSAQTVTISDATSGATIYYTTNGTTPTASSTKYTGAITVSSSETLEAIAVATGYTNSATGTAVYTIQQNAAATPTLTPAATSYTTPVTVSLNDTTAGATIYYTTNGTTPTTSSTVYTGPFTVSANTTIQAIAVASGYATSATGSGTYSILAATPSFSPAPGTYSGPQTVTISDPTAGVTIYYTTNGTMPTTSSSVYTAPITISSSGPLLAIAVKTGLTNSYVGAGAYTINNTNPTATPVISLAGGTYNKNQTVTISDATAGAAIYYTTDGSTPTTSSARYTGAITISTSETLQAIALASGYGQSGVAGAT
jgi:hypothetical protein